MPDAETLPITLHNFAAALIRQFAAYGTLMLCCHCHASIFLSRHAALSDERRYDA